MKKIVLFCLILAAIPIIVISGSIKSQNRYNYYPNLTKDDKWEYVKERVFDGETENIHKFSRPILIELESAHSVDSAAVDLVFDELRALMPHKSIDYFENYTGTTLISPKSYGDKKIKGRCNFKRKHD